MIAVEPAITPTSNGNADVEATQTTEQDDPLFVRLMQEARDTLKEEPELCNLLHKTVLAEGVSSWEDAVATTVAYRLLPHQQSNDNPEFCPHAMKNIIMTAIHNNTTLEHGHTMAAAVRQDALAVLDRDPACHTLLEVVLFYKGFSALVCHRAARQKWDFTGQKRSMTALFLQSQASANFGLDIHPGATIGAGVFLDHGTGVVIGETAWVGDGCTLLHGVTLGGTGKESGDRHPKVGKNVLIGAGASILGNISLGNASKIGAGSIVLKPIPPGATAVGAPAKIIGRATEANPAATMDDTLQNVQLLHVTPNNKKDTKKTKQTKNDNNNTTKEVASSTSSKSLNTLATEPTTASPVSERRVLRSSDSSISSASISSTEDDYANMDVVGVCPYREYRRMSITAPKQSITICTLYKLLGKFNVPTDVIGCTFFALDTENNGFVECTEENCLRLLQILRDELAFSNDLKDLSSPSNEEEGEEMTTNNTNEPDIAAIEQAMEAYLAKQKRPQPLIVA